MGAKKPTGRKVHINKYVKEVGRVKEKGRGKTVFERKGLVESAAEREERVRDARMFDLERAKKHNTLLELFMEKLPKENLGEYPRTLEGSNLPEKLLNYLRIAQPKGFALLMKKVGNDKVALGRELSSIFSSSGIGSYLKFIMREGKHLD